LVRARFHKGGHGAAPHPAPCFQHGAGPLQLRVQPAPSGYPGIQGAEGVAGWRALFLRDRTKIIWHHASKVITLYTKLQCQVRKRSMCQVYFKWPWKWGHELEPLPALQSHSSPCPSWKRALSRCNQSLGFAFCTKNSESS
jgi:hypothetical protein